MQKTASDSGDSWLPTDVDCLPGCYCDGGLLLDDLSHCRPIDRCPCYHPYTGQAVAPGNTADLLCGDW